MERRAIRPRTRFEVLKRDSFRCVYCGAHPPGVTLEVDHVVPVALGGANDQSNLVTACETCNAGKGAIALVSGSGFCVSFDGLSILRRDADGVLREYLREQESDL